MVNSEIVFEMADSYSSQLTRNIAHRRVAFFVGKSYLLLQFMRIGKMHFSATLARSCLLVPDTQSQCQHIQYLQLAS